MKILGFLLLLITLSSQEIMANYGIQKASFEIGTTASEFMSIALGVTLTPNKNVNKTTVAEFQSVNSKLTQIISLLKNSSLNTSIGRVTSEQLQIISKRLKQIISYYEKGPLTEERRNVIEVSLEMLVSQTMDIYTNIGIAATGRGKQNISQPIEVLISKLNQDSEGMIDLLGKNINLNQALITQYLFAKLTNIPIEIGIAKDSQKVTPKLTKQLRIITCISGKIKNQISGELSKRVRRAIIAELQNIKKPLQRILSEVAKMNKRLGVWVALLITVAVRELRTLKDYLKN